MASTYTPLGVEKMATGENAGTWGDKTNTNLEILEQISGGYATQTLNAAGSGANTTTLSVSDGSTGATLSTRIIILGAESAQAITGNKIVTIPLDVENWYFIQNNTSGAYTVQFKYVSGSGGSVTWATTDKGWKAIYASANDGTNPDVVDIGMGDVTLAGTQTLTNKTLTSPKIGTSILDTNGNELALLTATGSAVNEITLANGATGNAPSITASGETNVDLNLSPKGTGRVVLGAGAIQNLTEKATVSATAATGTINYDVRTQAVLYYTSAATGNFTVNVRGDGSTTLNNIMDIGESVTVAFLVTCTGSAYYNNAFTIDGSSVTPEWQGGSAPTGGNTNSVDVYTYTIFKTGDATFTAFASQTQFA